MRQTDKHLFFWGGYLSQWFIMPFTIKKVTYNCAEQYMMAQKALLFGDINQHKRIMEEQNPQTQKALGRKIEGFNDEIWDMHKEKVVYDANYAKFSQNPGLNSVLLDTGDLILVEASPYDKIWGIGLAVEDRRADDEKNWKGLNLLGITIMKVRSKLNEKRRSSMERAE